MDELESFVTSETFNRMATIPITALRARSYMANPLALPNDIALYLGFIDNQLVAFRSIFAGSVNSENKKIRFGWCSGAWVHPNFRGQGFSMQLLHEALADWEGKLMLTNYSPQTEKLFLKSGKFQAVHQFNGFRGYLFPKTRKLIPAANTNAFSKLIFGTADILIWLWSTIRLWFFRNKTAAEIRFETAVSPDKACFQMLNKKTETSFFQRGEKELKWIFEFPWVTDKTQDEFKKYPFSGYSVFFRYYTVKVFVKNQFSGFFIFSVREGHLKTLLFSIPGRMEEEIAVFLKQFCKKHKIEVITVYNNEIAHQLFKRKFPFLHAKNYGQKIYSSFLPETGIQQLFQDGDGDVIFT